MRLRSNILRRGGQPDSPHSRQTPFYQRRLPRLLADLRRKEEALRTFGRRRTRCNHFLVTGLSAKAARLVTGQSLLCLCTVRNVEKFTPDSRWVQNTISPTQLNKAKARSMRDSAPCHPC